mmetsp:Transcript_18971/g.53001  ORF Transcript_18971/g.53001 Transcript_18971/m.53001 type:complete len:253 (+) Transcript_18971:507-1265(+)
MPMPRGPRCSRRAQLPLALPGQRAEGPGGGPAPNVVLEARGRSAAHDNQADRRPDCRMLLPGRPRCIRQLLPLAVLRRRLASKAALQLVSSSDGRVDVRQERAHLRRPTPDVVQEALGAQAAQQKQATVRQGHQRMRRPGRPRRVIHQALPEARGRHERQLPHLQRRGGPGGHLDNLQCQRGPRILPLSAHGPTAADPGGRGAALSADAERLCAASASAATARLTDVDDDTVGTAGTAGTSAPRPQHGAVDR